MRVLGVVGYSGSGKTTLIEVLLPRLTLAGLRVSVVKHSHHDVQLEAPGKDSARFRAAGAAQVLLASPYRWALSQELHGEPESPLCDLLTQFASVDLVLVEGYKTEPHCKIEVYRPAVGQPPLYPVDATIELVLSDVPVLGRAYLNVNDVDAITAWVLNYARG